MAIYKLVLILSVFLIVAGILLSSFSLFSPLWQIVDIPKLYVSHQHGLWWDCTVPEGALVPLMELETKQKGNKCMSKFDPEAQSILRTALESADDASKEVLLHRFLSHHKAVVFFSVFTFLFGLIGIVIGACSPCFPPNSLLYVVATFMTSVCSILADIIFVFAALKDEKRIAQDTKDTRLVQTRLGLACYVHMLASCLFLFALIFSVGSAYFLISSKEGAEGCCIRKHEYAVQRRWQHNRSRFICDRKTCRPFVVVDDDSV